MNTIVRPDSSAAVSALFRRVADQGTVLAESLERGQAEMPLLQHFQSVQRGQSEAPFTLCVLGLSQAARTDILRWIIGLDFSLLSVEATRNLGLLELTLRERGYVLEGPRGSRREFDDVQHLIDALKEADVIRQGDGDTWVEPLRLAVPAAAGLQGVRLLMPENVKIVADDNAVLNRISRDCNALAIAAGREARLSDEDLVALEALVPSMDVVWPLVVIGEGESRSLDARGWWTDARLRGSGIVCSPIVISTDTALPPFLQNPQDPARRALFESQLSRGVRSAVDALNERYEANRRQLRMRKQKEERTEKGAVEVGTDATGRATADGLRNFLQEEFTTLQKGVQELNRKAMLVGGAVAATLDEALQTLQVTDLSQTPGHKVLQLTVSDSYLTHLTQAARRAAKDQLAKDLVLSRDGLSAAQAQFEKMAEKAFGSPLRIDFYPPDERALREVLGEVLRVQVRYKGEIPKRGFMQRLAEGRRLLFAALMTLSLFIGLLSGNSNARSLLAPFGLLFLIVFIGGVLWTYRSWQKEDAERLEKEVDKVKEQLRTEVQRLLMDAQREKMSRLTDHFEQLRREVTRRLDDFARQVSQHRASEQNRERQSARDRIRIIDQRIKDLDAQRSAMQKLEQDCTELRRECDKAIRACLGGVR
ncbi:hypothetical protein [Steroidobacter sp.]|uniref:hypothetical protein n=1 Tax=Steroidobacter sp. TaxID=1978227 RepID=UPI001A5F8BCA|nr:hypothetical protein [Steroidobacter sp.]MBL8270982.1 hypothetical protein [Steroidobacter sp.]